MTFAPNTTERIARARADLRMGVPVVITGGGAAALVFAAETLTPARLDELRGTDAVIALTEQRAATLKVAAYDGDLVRLTLPQDADLAWVQAMADPADDLRRPMKGPFTAQRTGTPLPHRAGIALTKAARLLPACIVVPVADGIATARRHDLTLLTAESALATTLSPLDPVISARLPLDVSDAGRLHIFRPDDGAEEHYAVEIGTPDRAQPVLARLHSACFTGDLLGSLKCDCGPQLRGALAQMGAEGAGVLLYLNQEGRGIGLANKMRAYSLQDQGFDTVEANHRLGFADDERDFRIGAELLRKLGFSQVRLLTNNPAKVAKLESCGLTVTERVPLKVGENRHNAGYLATKAAKSGHLL
ncbi:GTP cyclohydrolase II [Thalassorhabdomicrobium marinisediminis]|uniref:GTP cyclohydrolase-2 n=1 Tax=Thalassorhabdomicrobium marinisediminis TaxID=2170577 RepID=A0A2T7G096_9RHOB|nr:GTP cyclohydrolase II [Thalassorhabdomicrobium marinisediminis]PVA07825.1 GTP cyclohydrolase II [Thalassorhabdomicrobium marinisediminis]